MLEPVLIFFSWIFIIIMCFTIVVPYIRGRADLITTWNLFLIGSAVFIGYSTVTFTNSKHFLQYTQGDYLRFLLGTVAFYVTIFITYYKVKFPRQLAKRHFTKWPPATVTVLYFMLPVAGIFIVGMVCSPYVRVPGLYQIMFLLGLPVLAFSATLAFAAWYKQLGNPILFITWLVVILITTIVTVRFAFGRRPMVGILASIPVVAYWFRWRYRKSALTLAFMGILAFVGFLGISAYSQMRGQREFIGKDFSAALGGLRQMATNIFSPSNNPRNILSQGTTECAFLTIHMYTHDRKPEPFYSLRYIVLNPIPRVFWPGKPEALGVRLPIEGKETYGLTGFYVSRGYNWGAGIIGHGYHEGGVPILIIYAIIVGACLRFFDELLMNQPDNPYLIAGFVAMSGHIFGWPRGDIADFSLYILAAFFSMWLICRIGRLIYGTGLVYPRPTNTPRLIRRVSVNSTKPTQ